jgi:hypothetical protein
MKFVWFNVMGQTFLRLLFSPFIKPLHQPDRLPFLLVMGLMVALLLARVVVDKVALVGQQVILAAVVQVAVAVVWFHLPV